jgi:hypothetical protein
MKMREQFAGITDVAADCRISPRAIAITMETEVEKDELGYIFYNVMIKAELL